MTNTVNDPHAANLIGFWDFQPGDPTADTGLADGIAQDGHTHGDASFSGGQLHTDGSNDYFDVEADNGNGSDAPFDLTEGTVSVRFTQDHHVGSSPDSVVNRGEKDDKDDEGWFELRVTEDGRVEAEHHDGGNSTLLQTEEDFFEEGDTLEASYSWSPDTGATLEVTNVTQGTSTTLTDPSATDLTMDVTDNDDESWTFGARETDDGHYAQEFAGSIDYVKVYDKDVVNPGGDGVVEGDDTANDIDLAYTGDPEGDMIDAGDAPDGSNDDVVDARGGDDTVESALGDDTVFAGAGDDSVEGGTGDDVLKGDSEAPSATRESFEWDKAPDPNGPNPIEDGDPLSGFTQNTGSVDVTFSVLDESGDVETEFADNDQNVSGIDGGSETVDENSSLSSDMEDDSDSSAYRLDFSKPVENVDFRVNDIDGDGQVRVRAYDDQGNEVPVTLTGGDKLTLSDSDGDGVDDTATSTGGYQPDDSDDYSLGVEVDGPVSRIEIEHEMTGGADSGINVTDVHFDAASGGGAAGAGNDTLSGGEGDDVILGQGGADVLTGGDGSDSVEGGDGDDTIDTSGSEPLPDDGFGTTVPEDPHPGDDLDTVAGGAGNDSITTGDDADVITGGAGQDTIDGGLDDDHIDGGTGDDVIISGEGSDTVIAGEGNDTVYGGINESSANIPDTAGDPEVDNGDDSIVAGAGDDVVFGEDDDDTIEGGLGNDTLDGGVDDDSISGGSGDDMITGGQGADELSGGDDRDTFVIGSAEDGTGDNVDGGTGGDDVDTLDLTGSGPFEIVNETTDPDGDSTSGTINFLDVPGGTTTGSMTFSEIENIVPCFTPGTVIATPQGERRIEDLRAGDRVITRDNGLQEIRWIGRRALTGAELARASHLQPVLIRAGALGRGLPERDMLVSPQHRMLISNDRTALYFEEHEVLASAKHLTAMPGIERVRANAVTYIHFMFDHHEVVLSDGAWTESFQPGEQTLDGMGAAQRDEIFDLFPELRDSEGRAAYEAARRSLKRHEAQLLASA
ncbi:Hint domain-containing protein [Roseovarius salinarum]|uniref:Hint domain-containing protein n=1 Tax=Roseovarius salinarum TaxID=1981892 RepID=UPI000C34DF11|nr:Hint domain-containing protein [Roseovarius salinarum]